MPKGVYKHKPLSVIHKKRISEGNKGRIVSNQTRNKISKATTGKIVSQLTRDKQSIAHKGKPLSEKHKNSIGRAIKGNKKLIESLKRVWENPKYRQHMSEVHKGQHNSPITEFQKGRKGLKGKDSPSWIDGRTPEHKIIRASIEFRLWREAVFARDNYTCQKYGTRGGKLHPHHIKNFSKYPNLRFAIDNGLTLSEKAHREFHKIYGCKNNTKKQLIEFLNNN